MFLGVIILLFFTPAAFAAETLPSIVKEEIKEAELMCDGEFHFNREHVKAIDLNNDKKLDYILSSQAFNCSTIASIYSGSAGYSHTVFLTQSSGEIKKQDPISAYQYKIDERFSPPILYISDGVI